MDLARDLGLMLMVRWGLTHEWKQRPVSLACVLYAGVVIRLRPLNGTRGQWSSDSSANTGFSVAWLDVNIACRTTATSACTV